MGQGAGHVYGTERSRKRDGIVQVEAEGLDGSGGPVCGRGPNDSLYMAVNGGAGVRSICET